MKKLDPEEKKRRKKERDIKYRQKNKDKLNEYQRKWRKNSIKYKENRRLYRQTDKYKEQYTLYVLMNKEKIRIRNSEYRKNNKEKISKRSKEYRLKNLDSSVKAIAEWRKNNPNYFKEYRMKNIEYIKRHDKMRYYVRNYGITEEDFLNLIRIQNNKCDICRVDFSCIKTKDIHVDHCHETGQVRGVLCRWCNLTLGHAKDSINILELSIDYLYRHKWKK